MEKIVEKSIRKIHATSTEFIRGIMTDINWNARLIGIKGARGIGKTTLLLQYIKLHLTETLDKVLYVSLDNIWFSDNKLCDLVEYFVKRGGNYLFLDEVHKYPNWSVEIKNIYDDYPELKIVFTGSSLLEMLNARADLSRRAVIYNMQGLSFREYINLTQQKDFSAYSLEEIIKNHQTIVPTIISTIKPIQYFDNYLKQGYYPFFTEQEELYVNRLEEVINMILEVELPLLRSMDIVYVRKIKQLLLVISESAPFIPNINKLSERIGINRATLLQYIFNLSEAHLIKSVYKNAKGITRLQKPDKLFLENTNLMYVLSPLLMNKGNSRETFFNNQLTYKHQVEVADTGDFIINQTYVFEIGGQNKTRKQIVQTENAYLALDNIEYGHNSTIPLWLFGFLY